MFVNLWKLAPFLRLIVPLMAGMTIAMYVFTPYILSVLIVLLTIAFVPLPLKWRFALRGFRGACLLTGVLCFGMLLMQQADIRKQADWYGHYVKDTAYLTVTLLETPLKKTNSWRAEARVLLAAQQAVKGSMFLYFREQPKLRYGDTLMICAELREVKGMGNPGEFDYGRYCSYKNIFHQAFLRESQFVKMSHSESHDWLIESREYCLQTLRKYIPQKEEYGIAQALLIGYREELDKEIVQAYTNTGVVHIIAISGLHLGLIYVTLLQLLSWTPKKRSIEIAKAILLIAVLWVFSLLTGASASVLRSAVMFTTIAVGQYMITRHTNIYNTLSSAAFFLLCYNPYFLVDAGFQLSFLAVAGILLCYKPIYDWWMVRNKWVDKLWQMIAVSLAAQVFTWPVCLLYFHQFPNLFLLANIIAVPLSTILLYAEILLMCCSTIPLIASWLGKITGWGIMVMNTLIQWIDRIPGAVTSNIPIDMIQTTLLYIAVCTGCCWLLAKWKPACYATLGVIVIYAMYGVHVQISTADQQKLIVYNIPRQSVIESICGRESMIYNRDTLDEAAQQRYIVPARLHFRVRNSGNEIDSSINTLHLIRQKLILRLHRLPRQPPPHPLQIDYILLSRTSKVDISRLHQYFTYDCLIFDATCSAFLIRKWKNAVNKLPLRSFSVPDEGAFVLNL